MISTDQLRVHSLLPEYGLYSPLIISPSLRAEREERSDGMSFAEWFKEIDVWLKARPLIMWSDGNKDNIAKLLLGEIEEFYLELDRSGAQLNYADAWKEAVDTLFFAVSYFASNGLKPDADAIRRGMNGWTIDHKSFEYLRMLASQVEGTNPVATLERLVTVWASMVTKLDKWTDVSLVVKQVVGKNTGNYPQEYFQLESELQNGVVIKLESETEKRLATEHRVRCLRTIREVLKIVRPKDPIMRAGDHLPYRDLIVNYGVDSQGVYSQELSERNYLMLCHSLVDRYAQLGLTLEMVLNNERQPHKLVQPINGVLLPGQQWQINTDLTASQRTVQVLH